MPDAVDRPPQKKIKLRPKGPHAGDGYRLEERKKLHAHALVLEEKGLLSQDQIYLIEQFIQMENDAFALDL